MFAYIKTLHLETFFITLLFASQSIWPFLFSMKRLIWSKSESSLDLRTSFIGTNVSPSSTSSSWSNHRSSSSSSVRESIQSWFFLLKVGILKTFQWLNFNVNNSLQVFILYKRAIIYYSSIPIKRFMTMSHSKFRYGTF